MNDGFFYDMKTQMVPSPSVEAALKYRLVKEKRPGVASYVIRWVPAAMSVICASLLIFNMTMPAKAEQLPIVGKAFASLNAVGRSARETGKTPSFLLPGEKSEPFDIKVSAGECNGLDLMFRIELRDSKGTVTDKADTVTMSGVAVKLFDTYIYPTNEEPRLKRAEDGVFYGWASFNTAGTAQLLSHGKTQNAILYCEALCAYVEGATYEESQSLYTYELSAAEEFPFETDLSQLEIEYLGLEQGGVTVEYSANCGERTDIVYSVDDSVEYAKCFSVYTDKAAPDLITLNCVDDGGKSIYSAIFKDGEKESLDSEKDEFNEQNRPAQGESLDDDTYVGGDGSIIIYSNATGEYMIFECEEAEK